jgi:hypothetical protein
MAYDTFLQVVSQLSGQKRARCVLQDQIIFIDRQQKNRWVLSTKVFHGEGYLPPSVSDCLSSSGVLRWNQNGASLQLDHDSKSIYLIHEIDAANRYTHFRFLMKDFATIAKEWHTTFEDLASSDLNNKFH